MLLLCCSGAATHSPRSVRQPSHVPADQEEKLQQLASDIPPSQVKLYVTHDIQPRPAHGSHSDIGQRSSMEDAHTARPYFCEASQRLLSSVPTSDIIPPALVLKHDFPSSTTGGRSPTFGNSSTRANHRPDTAGTSDNNTHTDNPMEPLHMYAVYDGHGGSEVAQLCSRHLHRELRQALAEACDPSDISFEAQKPYSRSNSTCSYESSQSVLSKAYTFAGDQQASAFTRSNANDAPEALRHAISSSTLPILGGAAARRHSARWQPQEISTVPSSPTISSALSNVTLNRPCSSATTLYQILTTPDDPSHMPGSRLQAPRTGSTRRHSDSTYYEHLPPHLGLPPSQRGSTSRRRSMPSHSWQQDRSTGRSRRLSASSAGSRLEGQVAAAAGTLPLGSGPVEAALVQSFLAVDELLAERLGPQALLTGATAVVALVGGSHIWLANAGDCRAVLVCGGKALQLTHDHKTDRADEVARVKAGGGVVFGTGRSGPRVQGVLAVTRSLGDHGLRPHVTALPEISHVARHPDDHLLLLASDGLWDVMSCQEAASLALQCLASAKAKSADGAAACRVAARVLTRAAVENAGSADNVTVLVVDLAAGQPAQPAQPAAPARAAGS